MMRDLLVAGNKTFGMRLLQKMGWKQGQGVGARVKLSDVHGGVDKSALPTAAIDYSSFDITKAPEDLTVNIPPPKTDTHGMGFSRKAGDGVLSRPRASASAYYVSDLFSKESDVDGFLYNDEDDTYAGSSVGTKRSGQYSSEEILMDDESSSFGTSESVHAWVKGSGQQTRGVLQKCHTDARPVLEGFVLADLSRDVIAPKIYRLSLPEGYAPAGSLFQVEARKPRASRWGDSASAVSESVFTILSDESKARIKKAVEGGAVPGGSQLRHTEPSPQDVLTATSEAELRASRFGGLSEAFRNRFVAAASSLSSAGADNSISGLKSASEFTSQFGEKLQTDSFEREAFKAAAIPEPRRISRVTSPWDPSPLMCKRFNVPVPARNATAAPTTRGRGEELFEKHVGVYMTHSAAEQKVDIEDTDVILLKPPAETTSNDNDLLLNAAMSVVVRPSLSMLKSIFDSDSESDGDEDIDDKKTDQTENIEAPYGGSSIDVGLKEPASIKDRDSPPETTETVVYLKRKYLESGAATDICYQSRDLPTESEGKIIFKKPAKSKEESVLTGQQVLATTKRKAKKAALSFNVED
jgi:hypothetical protein